MLKSFTERWDNWVVEEVLKGPEIKTSLFREEVNIFSSLKNWTFSEADIEAEKIYGEMVTKTRADLPFDFYHSNFLANFRR